MPRKQARYGVGAVNLPGFPPNVRHSPQAAAQVAAQQAAQQGGFNPVLQQFNAPQQQQPSYAQGAPAGMQQGPLAGMMNMGLPQPSYAGPTAAMQQQQGFQGQVPQPTPQNTTLNSVQSLDPSRNQPADPSKWYHNLLGPIAGWALPNTPVGRQWNDTLFGAPPELHKASRFTDYQQNVLNFLAQQGLLGLGQTQQSFAPIGNQELERFYTQTIPSLAERFTSMGGGQRSSAFQGALGNAGRGLGNDLASLQGQYNLQQQGNLLNMINLGLTPQFENVLKEGGTGLLKPAGQAAAKVASAYVTGGLAG